MAADKKSWNGKHVLHEQHIPALEQAAAIAEFQHGLPRHEAESKAYGDYRKAEHEKAAAYHLRGLKSAQGAGDLDAAKTHGAMFEAHMTKLGHDAWKEVPPEIQVHMDAPEKEKVHKFKATGADQFVLDDHKVQPDEPIAKSLAKLYKKAKAALEVLQKSVKP